MDELVYWLWLSLRCGAGSGLGSHLLNHFISPQAIYQATRATLLAVEGIGEAVADAFDDHDLSHAERILEYCQRTNTGILTIADKVYPDRLRRIHPAPLLLYYRGRIPNIDEKVLISCVGTRHCSETGRRTAYRLGRDLASAGAIVVSGMAAGIDAAAHEGALAAGGETIAVFGCGIDRAYPPQNSDLMRRIITSGLVLSEYAPGTEPNGVNFPIRNRIISGLSQGTVVVEATRKSGSLITARDAKKQGRDVFAFPGRPEELLAEGTNDLIRDGAKLVSCAKDVLEEYELTYPNKIFTENIPGWERKATPQPREKLAWTQMTETPVVPARSKAAKTPTQNKKTKAPAESTQSRCSRGVALSPDGTAKMPGTEKLTEKEKQVFLCLLEEKTADEILNALQKIPGVSIRIGELLGILTILELNGLIKALPGGRYRRI